MTIARFNHVSLGVPGGVFLLACLGETGSGMILHRLSGFGLQSFIK